MGGLIAAAAGAGTALWASCGLLLLAAVVLVFSRFRYAGEDQHLTSEPGVGSAGVFPHRKSGEKALPHGDE